jgi:hypothetical protein
MKRIVFIALLVLLFGCEERSIEDRKRFVQISDGRELEMKTIKFEGCEYLQFYTYSGNYVLSHKGNCSSPIHKK